MYHQKYIEAKTQYLSMKGGYGEPSCSICGNDLDYLPSNPPLTGEYICSKCKYWENKKCSVCEKEGQIVLKPIVVSAHLRKKREKQVESSKVLKTLDSYLEECNCLSSVETHYKHINCKLNTCACCSKTYCKQFMKKCSESKCNLKDKEISLDCIETHNKLIHPTLFEKTLKLFRM